MQPIQSKPSSAAPAALVYITVGALLMVLGVIWLLYELGMSRNVLICACLLLMGIASLSIGLSMGKLHKKAQEGELIAQANANAVPQQDPALARKL